MRFPFVLFVYLFTLQMIIYRYTKGTSIGSRDDASGTFFYFRVPAVIRAEGLVVVYLLSKTQTGIGRLIYRYHGVARMVCTFILFTLSQVSHSNFKDIRAIPK